MVSASQPYESGLVVHIGTITKQQQSFQIVPFVKANAEQELAFPRMEAFSFKIWRHNLVFIIIASWAFGSSLKRDEHLHTTRVRNLHLEILVHGPLPHPRNDFSSHEIALQCCCHGCTCDASATFPNRSISVELFLAIIRFRDAFRSCGCIAGFVLDQYPL
jgi:hypothetical protein